MKSFQTLTLIALMFGALSPNPVRAASDTLFDNFSTCSGVINGSPVTLDLFQEIGGNKDQPLETGYAYQSMTVEGKPVHLLSKTKVAFTPDHSSRQVTLYNALEPGSVLSSFSLPSTKPSKVEIREPKGEGKTWGSFACKPQGVSAMSSLLHDVIHSDEKSH